MSEQPMFDLGDTVLILEEALETARRLDLLTVPEETPDSKRKGDAAVAQANRDVQHLEHLCQRAAAETGAAYWRTRGYKDPL